jgi:hypothetical protein
LLGAAQPYTQKNHLVFGVIMGTGVGGGIVINGKVWDGGNYARMSDQVSKVVDLIDPGGNNDSRSALSQYYDDDEPTTPVVKRVEDQ